MYTLKLFKGGIKVLLIALMTYMYVCMLQAAAGAIS